jgi:hypothetical protein
MFQHDFTSGHNAALDGQQPSSIDFSKDASGDRLLYAFVLAFLLD